MTHWMENLSAHLAATEETGKISFKLFGKMRSSRCRTLFPQFPQKWLGMIRICPEMRSEMTSVLLCECLIGMFDLERTRAVGFCWKVVDTISELKALNMTSSSNHLPGLDDMLMHWCDGTLVKVNACNYCKCVSANM